MKILIKMQYDQSLYLLFFYRGKNETIVIYMLDLFENNDPKLSNMFIFI